jgi:hypothetical protein
MDEKQNTSPPIKVKGGGFFGSSNSFGSAIKKTKSSEASLIKNYESMEKATKDYNQSFKEHISNLNKLDDYANFSGMKNLFQKVIMKDVITQGAKVDSSMPLLFRNYHIEKEPTPSAFRREHILNQVRYILATSFAGREHMLIKYMSVEIGRSQFILNITTIENIKKSRTIDHNGYVIDAGATRAALKDILSATKKNLRRRTALVEIGRGSSVGKNSRRKRTSKSSSGKKLSRSKSSGFDDGENSFDLDKMDIGSSKESIKSLTKKRREPSNKLSATSMLDLKSFKLSDKQSKPSIYKRPSEKRPAVIAPVAGISPAGIPLAPTALAHMPITGDFAEKKQDILGGTAPLPAATSPAYSPYTTPMQPQQPYLKPKKCKENMDQASCQSQTECWWDVNYQSCKFNNPNFARGPGGAPPATVPLSPPTGMAFPGFIPQPAAAPASPPPMMEAI